MLEELWKRLLALHVLRYLPILLAPGLAWLKRKAIAAAIGTFRKEAAARFWGWLRKKVSAGPQTNERTYKGVFFGYFQYANYPHEWCFQLDDGGVKTKVPTMRTNLFSGVAPGSYVEVDTQVLPSYKVEVVKRVRVREQGVMTTRQ